MPPKPNVTHTMKIKTSVETPPINPIRNYFFKKIKSIREAISNAFEPPTANGN